MAAEDDSGPGRGGRRPGDESPDDALDPWSRLAEGEPAATETAAWRDLAGLDGEGGESVAADPDALDEDDDDPIGGLLGVDSGLLRFLEKEEAIRATAPEDEASGALPEGLDLLDDLAAESLADEPLVDAAFAAPLGDDVGALPEDFDLPSEGAAPGEPDGGALPAGFDADPAVAGDAPDDWAEASAPDDSAEASATAPPQETVVPEAAAWLDDIVRELEVDDDRGAGWANDVVSVALIEEVDEAWADFLDELPPEELELPAPRPHEPPEPAEPPVDAVAVALGGEVDPIDLSLEEPIPDSLYQRAEAPSLVDTWGTEEGALAVQTVAEPASDLGLGGRIDELDPFAVPVSASLQDETGLLDDPFDSVGFASNLPSGSGSDGRLGHRATAATDAWDLGALQAEASASAPRPQPPSSPPRAPAPSAPPSAPPARRPAAAPVAAPAAIPSAPSPPPTDEPEALPDTVPPGDQPPVDEPPPAHAPTAPLVDEPADEAAEGPSPAEVEAALALLGRRSRARRAELPSPEASGEVLAVEEELQDGPDRRVIKVEYPDIDALDVVELADEPGQPTLDGEPAEGGGFVFFDDSVAPPLPPASRRESALEALSREPVALSALLDALADEGSAPAEDAPIIDADADAHVAAAVAPLRVDPADVVESSVATPLPGPALADGAPSWGEAPAAAPTVDAADFAEAGVPFLGAIPLIAPAPPTATFPPGALPELGLPRVEGPPVVPTLALPAGDALDADGRLLLRLAAEVEAETDRGRLAVLLHAIGRVAEGPGAAADPALARVALQAAAANDGAFDLNRFALHARLLDEGRADAVVAHLARRGAEPFSDAAALHRAGHLALARLDDADRAVALWRRAQGVDARWLPPALSRFVVHLGKLDWAAAAEAIDAALAAAQGPLTWGVLALERARLAEELDPDPATLDALFEGAVRRRGGAAGVVAALERYAVERGRFPLLLTGLRARFDHVMAAYQGGQVTEPSAQWEVGEVFYKAAWALERMGRRAEALNEYQNALRTLPDDPFLLYRAGELARRLGRSEEHRGHLERIARQARTPAEAANAYYQMGLIAQQVLADDTAAAADFERAVQALPTFTPALAALGRQALRQGRFDELHARFAREIEQLEAALDDSAPPAQRQRAVRGLVHRYYRVARLLDQSMGEAEVALGFDKRALALDPDFLPSFVALEHAFEVQGRWRDLVALYLGRAEHAQLTPQAQLATLLGAADIVRVHLRDPANAGRLYARALALAPDDAVALRRASDTFARLGHQAARIEVELRWGRQADDPETALRLVQAARLQELDGDSLAAAAEALPLYREALARLPESAAAVDGAVRATGRLGRAGALAQLVEQHDLGSLAEAELVLPLAEALLAGGRLELAGTVLRSWRSRARTEGALPPSVDAASLALLSLVHERSEDWRALVDVLEEQALVRGGATRAALLARVGELWELRLDDPALAEDAYARALTHDPTCGAALDGRRRLATAHRAQWTPTADAAAALRRRARGTTDRRSRAALLEQIASRTDDLDDATAWRALARGARTLADDAVADPVRFDQELRQRSAARDHAGAVALLRARLPGAEASERPALARALLRHALAAGDAEAVAEATAAAGGGSVDRLATLLARRRMAQRAGDGAAAADAGVELLDVLQAPATAATMHRAVALEAEAAGAAPARVRALLERAVEADPTDDAVADALARRLAAAADWAALRGLYDRRLRALAAPRSRRAVARAKAALLAEAYDDLPGALQTLAAELEAEAPDPATCLAAAGYAVRLQRHEAADDYFARAAQDTDPAQRWAARGAWARSLLERGRTSDAERVLTAHLAEAPESVEALEALAEVLAAQRKWRAVVKVFHKLLALTVEPGARAERAMAIAEIHARVFEDHRGAAGWFKRAVELDPTRLRATWRLIEEARRAPAEAVPAAHVDDAVDRAIVAQRQAAAERPGDPEPLVHLARLLRQRGQADACFLVCAALDYLGAAPPPVRAFYLQRRERVAVDFARPLSPELRRDLLVHPGERGPARALFDAFWLVLTELLADRMAQGIPRLSRRSFAEWQADFRALAAGLGLDDVELWNAGRSDDPARALYLPQPALAVASRLLEGRIDAAQAFALGHRVEGLREGRLLFERHGVERVERCVRRMAGVVSPDLLPPMEGEPLPEALEARLVERARRLPRRLKLQLDALAGQGGVRRAPDFDRLARAIEATRTRAGLLCCGDLATALDQVVFADAAAAEAARGSTAAVRAALDASPVGRGLLNYALSPNFERLRHVLGLAVS